MAAAGPQIGPGAGRLFEDLRRTFTRVSEGDVKGDVPENEELERAAITLTEGGGGALYQVCGRLKNAA